MSKLRCIPQELLKLIACITMLIDHIGAAFFPQYRFLRIIGRISFPIYCFLLSEGIRHTRDPKKYLLRLFVGILLAELPFDCLFFGALYWQHQSVMVTLFLGTLMLLCLDRADGDLKFVLVLPFAALAELAMCDYGALGILLIAVFHLAPSRLWQLLGVFLLCFADDCRYILESLQYFTSWQTADAIGYILRNAPPLQTFATVSMVPIALYSERKLTHSKALQTAFYLFYPAHLAILLLFT